ncbi:hypothetical protein [Hallerella succinigenes]|uniref:Aspartyl protease n=1 Tax=Hallerella succinigenes TaxID=1896222 RepID=A0A2M9A8L7_9BACT|nr:hypothetical protein [Hallerella succinigenes]PJJ42008.1 hypothetical protein BGX16_2022 [Hallerella succinigenes]
MEIYKLIDDVNGYFVFEKGQNMVLVDTGSPFSFHCGSEPLSICYTTCVTGNDGDISEMSQRLHNVIEKDAKLAPLRTLIEGFSLENLNGLFRSRHGQALAKTLGLNIEALKAAHDGDAKMTAKVLGIDFDAISKHVGVPITTILGTDCLSKFKIVIDKIRNQIMFDTEEIPFEGSSIATVKLGDCMGIEVKLNGVPRKVLLDTGITSSYADKVWLDGCADKGRRIDYHPLADYYTVPVFRALTEFGGRNYQVKYGVMPDILKTKIMEVTGLPKEAVLGVLGASILEDRRFYIDFSTDTFCVGPF